MAGTEVELPERRKPELLRPLAPKGPGEAADVAEHFLAGMLKASREGLNLFARTPSRSATPTVSVGAEIETLPFKKGFATLFLIAYDAHLQGLCPFIALTIRISGRRS